MKIADLLLKDGSNSIGHRGQCFILEPISNEPSVPWGSRGLAKVQEPAGAWQH